MARPKIMRPKDGGEIILRNVSVEVSNKVEELLENDGALHIAPAALTEEVSQEELMYSALGLCKVDDTFFVVTVKYNPHTKEAVVDSLEDATKTKAFADNKFKIDAIRKGIL